MFMEKTGPRCVLLERTERGRGLRVDELCQWRRLIFVSRAVGPTRPVDVSPISLTRFGELVGGNLDVAL